MARVDHDALDFLPERWTGPDTSRPRSSRRVETVVVSTEQVAERTRRVIRHLALLRAPLAGLELDTRDHAVLTYLADADDDTVTAVSDLLGRARAAASLPDPPAPATGDGR